MPLRALLLLVFGFASFIAGTAFGAKFFASDRIVAHPVTVEVADFNLDPYSSKMNGNPEYFKEGTYYDFSDGIKGRIISDIAAELEGYGFIDVSMDSRYPEYSYVKTINLAGICQSFHMSLTSENVEKWVNSADAYKSQPPEISKLDRVDRLKGSVGQFGCGI